MGVPGKGVYMDAEVLKHLRKYALNLSQAQSAVRTVLKEFEAHLVCNPHKHRSEDMTHVAIDVLMVSSVQ